MLIIRLQRVGSRNQPHFRLTLAEKHRASSKKVQEIFGEYNPRTKDFKLSKEDRLKYWLGQNVALSPTVRNLLVEKKLLTGAKVQAWKPRRKPAEENPSGGAPATASEATPETPQA